jgi:hypothetical protein
MGCGTEGGGETGVHLAVLEDPPRLWVESGAEVGLDDVYQDQLPSPPLLRFTPPGSKAICWVPCQADQSGSRLISQMIT